MSRGSWRCRNPACPTPQGAILGHLGDERTTLLLDPAVRRVVVRLDVRRADVTCPACGTVRSFRGAAVVRTVR
jgi:hypothetical protein